MRSVNIDHNKVWPFEDFILGKRNAEKKSKWIKMLLSTIMVLVGLGCRTAVEFDAGGSTSLLWKSKNSGTVQKVTGGGRSLTMVMYFTE